jgi:glycogen operon protein
VKLYQPDWSPWSRSIALGAELPDENLRLYFIVNSYWESLEFELPTLTNKAETWERWIDTSFESPDDICDWQAAPPVSGLKYQAGPRSVVLLLARTGIA